MDLNRPAQAVDHLTRDLQSATEGTRSQAAHSLSLAYLRLGLAEEAAPITDRQAIELEIAILSEKPPVPMTSAIIASSSMPWTRALRV